MTNENEIKIEESSGQIIHTSKEMHNENSLIEKYQRELMGLNVLNAKLNQLPSVIAEMQMGIRISSVRIDVNQEKQESLEKALKDSDVDINQDFKKLKKKYTEEELMENTQKIISKTQTKIVKEGEFFVFKSEIKQTTEDALIELMLLKGTAIDLVEQAVKQENLLTKTIKSEAEFVKGIDETKERMKSIKLFFASRHKNIDQLLNQAAKARGPGQRVAQSLPK